MENRGQKALVRDEGRCVATKDDRYEGGVAFEGGFGAWAGVM